MIKENETQKIEEILERLENVYPSKEELKRVLKSEKKLTIYNGIDPTAPFLHLGHSVNLFILKRFQELGHKIILLIGDFTAQVGDPTGKDKKRKILTKEEVLKNCQKYQEQAGKIIDFQGKNPAILRFNSEWWEKINSKDFLKILSFFTVQRMLERDMFRKRQEEKKPIWLNEFIYPVLQGYDSVAMDVDAEAGGNDQTFNMLVGREMMKAYKNKEKIVITWPLISAEKGGKKMSKSEGEVIALNDSSNEMYGKTMSLPDEVIVSIFKLCTLLGSKEIGEIRKVSLRDQKARLAKEIVKIYHGEKKAQEAEKEFNRIFRDKKNPSDVPEMLIKEKKINILDLLVMASLVPSKSEAKRLVLQGGVKINNETQKDWQKTIEVKKGDVLRAGKRKFVKIK
ncbi:MAG: tyrosine--tRNA ligase [Candidatus Nealsonbacteria bacterium]|nr:tyrosine--tRNA ligase [Candidatus Nealsonbacteria bacterium]